MNCPLRLLVLPLALTLIANGLCQGDPPLHGKSFTLQVEKTLNYWFYQPEGYGADNTRDWPLVLFLHGAGERGADLEKVKIHGPPKLIAAGQRFPFLLAAPQCPLDQWWETDVLMALIEDLEANHRIDPDRIYVTGLSMGGYGTWELAMRYPRKFAAIVPICGGGVPYRTKNITHLPVWAFHGDADNAVGLSESRRLIDALEKRGAPNVKLTIYPGLGHDSWTRTYDSPEVFEWLLRHRRKERPD